MSANIAQNTGNKRFFTLYSLTLDINTTVSTWNGWAFQSTLPVWGATFQRCIFRPAGRYFNPRSPCGERQVPFFLLPAQRDISIHAPRVGSDGGCSGAAGGCGDFNPRSPCGERPGRPLALWGASYFNPRSPCGERLALIMVFSSITVDFNPRSPCGERPVGAS